VPRLSASSPKVVAEVIDGEAIILDLHAGTYFATDGVGAVAWSAVIDGWTTEDVVASAVAFFPGTAAGEEVAAVLDQFVEAGLLTSAAETGKRDVEGLAWPKQYATPILERHEDLQDMMQLDPIHDTDATGWPARSADHNA